MYKVYARLNDKGIVTNIFSSRFQNPNENDFLIKEGVGNEYIHVGYYNIVDSDGCFNYKVHDGGFVERTLKEKQEEIASRPEPVDQLDVINETMSIVSEDNLLNMDLLTAIDDKLNLIMEHLGLC